MKVCTYSSAFLFDQYNDQLYLTSRGIDNLSSDTYFLYKLRVVVIAFVLTITFVNSRFSSLSVTDDEYVAQRPTSRAVEFNKDLG